MEVKTEPKPARAASKPASRSISILVGLAGFIVLATLGFLLARSVFTSAAPVTNLRLNETPAVSENPVDVARSLKLAAASRDQIATNPALGYLLAVQATLTADTPQATGSLFEALQAQGLVKGVAVTKPSDHRQAASLSPNGKTFVFSTIERSIIFWDLQTNKQIGQPLVGHSDEVSFLQFSPDGRILASVDYDKNILLWQVETGKQLAKIATNHFSRVRSLAFSQDLQTLVSTSCLVLNDYGTCEKSELIIWEVATGKPRSQPLEGYYGAVLSVAFSPTGKFFVSGHSDGQIISWDIATGQPDPNSMQTNGYGINSLIFNPGGSILAAASTDGTIVLWDVEKRQIAQTLHGHKASVNSIAYNASGNLLLSGSSDRTIRLWNANTGEAIGQPLTEHTDTVEFVAFSPDGKLLVSANINESPIFWNFNLEELRAQACKLANRNLSQAEWKQFAGDIPYQKTCKDLA